MVNKDRTYKSKLLECGPVAPGWSNSLSLCRSIGGARCRIRFTGSDLIAAALPVIAATSALTDWWCYASAEVCERRTDADRLLLQTFFIDLPCTGSRCVHRLVAHSDRRSSRLTALRPADRQTDRQTQAAAAAAASVTPRWCPSGAHGQTQPPDTCWRQSLHDAQRAGSFRSTDWTLGSGTWSVMSFNWPNAYRASVTHAAPRWIFSTRKIKIPQKCNDTFSRASCCCVTK